MSTPATTTAATTTKRQGSIVPTASRLESSTPILNGFMQNVVSKSESPSYTENINALSSLSVPADLTTLNASDVNQRPLARLAQFGHINTRSVPILLSTLAGLGGPKEDRVVSRLLQYLIQLALGNGSAGTPLPVPPAAASSIQPKAVDFMSGEALSSAWADLASDKSAFFRKQAALRALAAVARASVTLKPDDATYVGGLFFTLTSLMDKLEAMRKDKSTLSNFLSKQSGKKQEMADMRTRLEMFALQRLAFSAARVALSRSALVKIAMRSFPGITSPDALGARHALALAALAARDSQDGMQAYIKDVGKLLKNNVELARKTGHLYVGMPNTAPPPTALQQLGVGSAPPAPVVLRDEQLDKYINLRDTWARVYLVRGCAIAIQSGFIAGDVTGRGAAFWQVLTTSACQDSEDSLVALEAIRAMFGAPFPKAATSLFGNKSTKQDLDAEMGQPKIFAASWHMIMSQADVEPAVFGGASEPQADGPSARGLFARITRRIIRCLQSKSRSLVNGAAKTIAVIAESRAWCQSMSGAVEEVLGPESVRKGMRQLQNLMAMVMAEESLGACERAAAADALLWLQLPDAPPLLTPGNVIKLMASGGSTVPEIVRATFADPWPESLVSSFLTNTTRRVRCTSALMDHCLALVVAAAAAAPSRVPREQLLQALDNAPGTSGLRAAMELLAAPPPPLSLPISSSAVEVKYLACAEEAAYESIKCQAAWWLGEHVNQTAAEQVWKPRPATQMAVLPAGLTEAAEKLALAGAATNPLLVTVVAHLQRAMLTGAWELRMVAAKALAQVAVRSGEPYRVQCYSVLAGTRRMGTSEADPLGISPVVEPALEILDAMYAGELVLDQYIASYGEQTSGWPKPTLRSVCRRHEWLLNAITQKICSVPRDMYLPLGPQSKALVKPEEKKEVQMSLPSGRFLGDERLGAAAVEANDRGEAENVGGEATAAEGQYEEGQYDNYGYDYDYGYEGQYEDEQYADPLEAYDGTADAAGGVAMQWGGVGDDTRSQGSGGGSQHLAGEDDPRYGTANFEFNPENDGEVAMAANERVRVHYDMGGWYHITNAAGASGLVPSSYIQLEDDYYYDENYQAPLSTAGSMRRTESRADGADGQYAAGTYDQSYYDDGYGYDDNAYYDNNAYYDQAQSSTPRSTTEGGGGTGYSRNASLAGAGFNDAASTGSSRRQTGPPSRSPSLQRAPSKRQPSVALSDASVAYGATRGVAMYEFVAEMDNELSVAVGDEVTLGPEVDGWYQATRVSDGVTGLLPSSYVRLA